MNNTIKITSVIILAALFSSCAVHVGARGNSGDISSVFGGIDIDEGATAGDLSSVNGGIDIENNATVGSVETVNGGIEIGQGVSIDSAETVNGSIEVGKDTQVKNGLETVNGSITAKQNVQVGESIETVNGDINIAKVTVNEDIKTTNGDIELAESSVVKGNIVIKDNDSWFSSSVSDQPMIKIDKSSSVLGVIHLHRKTKLKIEEGANIGDIKYHFERE